MNLRPLLSPALWLVMVLVAKFFLIGNLQYNRTQPLEADDAYSYLFHARTLFDDPQMGSPAQLSFRNLKHHPHITSDAQNLENRLYHRVVYYYHNAHAVMLRIINAVVNDYDWVWWIHLYLFTALWTLLSWQIARKLVSESALLGWIGSVFIFVSVAHQLTAAPREWANLGFLAIIACWVSLPVKPRAWQLLGIAIMAWATINTHPLGRAVVFMAAMLAFGEAALERWWKKVPNARSLSVGMAVLGGWVIGEVSARWLFPHIETPSYSNFHHRSFAEVLGVLWDDLLWQNMRTHGLPVTKFQARVLIILSALGGATIWFRRRHTLPLLWLAGLSVSMLIFVFYGQLYALPNYYYWFHTYLYSVFFFVVALAAGTCWGFLASKLPIRWAPPIVLLFLVIYSKIGVKRSYDVYKYWVDRQNIQSPRAGLEELKKYAVDNQCVVIHSEALLYEYLLTADFQRPVSFRFDCAGSYDLRGAPINCPYRLRPISEQCMYDYQVAWQNRDWALDCVGEACQKKR